MYKLCFYVPESHLEKVKTALFSVGAGKYGNFNSCSWQSLGSGQFRGVTESNQFVGNENELVKVYEFKVEMICQAKYIEAVLKKLVKIHPYETPAYSVYEIKMLQDFPE